MKCPFCETEINKHGRNECLNAWVYQDVFGHTIGWRRQSPVRGEVIKNDPCVVIDMLDGEERWVDVPNCSREIADAWQIVKKMEDKRYSIEIFHDLIAWSVCFTYRGTGKKYFGDWRDSIEVQICKAAIEACLEEKHNVIW